MKDSHSRLEYTVKASVKNSKRSSKSIHKNQSFAENSDKSIAHLYKSHDDIEKSQAKSRRSFSQKSAKHEEIKISDTVQVDVNEKENITVFYYALFENIG